MKPNATQLEMELSELKRKYNKKEVGGLKNFNKILDLKKDLNDKEALNEFYKLEKEGKLHPNLIEFGKTMIKSRENARDEKENPDR